MIVDGSNLVYRCHYAAKRMPDVIAGPIKPLAMPIFITLRAIRSYAEQFGASEVYCTWDKKLDPRFLNFRQQRLLKRSGGKAEAAYKGNRQPSEDSVSVHAAEEVLFSAFKMLGIRQIFPFHLEGDDAMHWLCRKLAGSIVIVTNDQDLLQEVRFNATNLTKGVPLNVVWYNATKKVRVDHTNFEKEIGVPAESFLDYKALVGDVSDNIEGVGITEGEAKSIARLLLQDIELSSEQRDRWSENKLLMDLHQGFREHPEEEPMLLEQFETQQHIQPDFDKFKSMCEDYQFNSILKDLNKWIRTFQPIPTSA